MFTSIETINLLKSQMPEPDGLWHHLDGKLGQKVNEIEGAYFAMLGKEIKNNADCDFCYYVAFLTTKEAFDIVVSVHSELLQVLKTPENLLFSIQQKPTSFKNDKGLIYKGIENVVFIMYEIKKETGIEATVELDTFLQSLYLSVCMTCGDFSKMAEYDTVVQKMKGN